MMITPKIAAFGALVLFYFYACKTPQKSTIEYALYKSTRHPCDSNSLADQWQNFQAAPYPSKRTAKMLQYACYSQQFNTVKNFPPHLQGIKTTYFWEISSEKLKSIEIQVLPLKGKTEKSYRLYSHPGNQSQRNQMFSTFGPPQGRQPAMILSSIRSFMVFPTIGSGDPFVVKTNGDFFLGKHKKLQPESIRLAYHANAVLQKSAKVIVENIAFFSESDQTSWINQAHRTLDKVFSLLEETSDLQYIPAHSVLAESGFKHILARSTDYDRWFQNYYVRLFRFLKHFIDTHAAHPLFHGQNLDLIINSKTKGIYAFILKDNGDTRFDLRILMANNKDATTTPMKHKLLFANKTQLKPILANRNILTNLYWETFLYLDNLGGKSKLHQTWMYDAVSAVFIAEKYWFNKAPYKNTPGVGTKIGLLINRYGNTIFQSFIRDLELDSITSNPFSRSKEYIIDPECGNLGVYTSPLRPKKSLLKNLKIRRPEAELRPSISLDLQRIQGYEKKGNSFLTIAQSKDKSCLIIALD